MELLGPRPTANRLIINTKEFFGENDDPKDAGLIQIGAVGGNGWEVNRTKLGEVEFTATLSDGNSPRVSVIGIDVTRDGKYVYVYRLGYDGQPATGGTFKYADSGDIPFDAMPDDVIAAFNEDPTLLGITAYGGPLNIEPIFFESGGRANLIVGKYIDGRKLTPGAQITAHVDGEKRKSIPQDKDPVEILAHDDKVIATYNTNGNYLYILEETVTPLGVGENQTIQYGFSLKYPEDVPDNYMKGGTFALAGQRRVELVGTFIMSDGRRQNDNGNTDITFNWITDPLAWDATGKQISDAVLKALSYAATHPTSIYSGYDMPIIAPGVQWYKVIDSLTSYSSGKVSEGKVTITFGIASAPVTIDVTDNGGTITGQVVGHTVLTTITNIGGDSRVTVDNRYMGGDPVNVYDSSLELIKTAKIGLNCLRLVKAQTGYKCICVSEDSQRELQYQQDIVGGYYVYGDGNGTHLQSVGQIEVLSQSGQHYPDEPFLAPWDTYYGFHSIYDTNYGTAYKQGQVQNSLAQWTFYGVDIRTIPRSKLIVSAPTAITISPMQTLYYYNLQLYVYNIPIYGYVLKPGGVIPKFVYRALDDNFKTTFETTFTSTYSFPGTITGLGGNAEAYRRLTAEPCTGFPAMQPLLKFSDGTFGVFGYLPKGVNAIQGPYLRYTEDNVLQFVKDFATAPEPTFNVYDQWHVSHVDVTDNIICVAVPYLGNGVPQPNGNLYKFDKNMHRLWVIPLKGIPLCCASDGDQNIYVVVANDYSSVTESSYSTSVYKYDRDGILKGFQKLANRPFGQVSESSPLKPTTVQSYYDPLTSTGSWFTQFNRFIKAFCDGENLVVHGATMSYWKQQYDFGY